MSRKKRKMKSTPLSRARDEMKAMKLRMAVLEAELCEAKADADQIFATLEAFEKLLRCAPYRTLRPKISFEYGSF